MKAATVIALMWIVASILITAACAGIAGRKTPAEQAREDEEQMTALTRWRAYEEHA